MKFLYKTKYKNGITHPWHVCLIATRKWCLDYHPHTRACKYGLYWNKQLQDGGLYLALNIPFLGDFALWRSSNIEG